MPLDLNMKTTGIDDALAEIAELTPASKRAATRAQNKTLRWARAQSASRLAKASRLPVKVLRGRTRQQQASQSKPDALLWVGTAPVPADQAGAIRQTRTGARAGRHSFPGSFVATMPDGHTGVYDRVGRQSLPIRREVIPLDGVTELERYLHTDGERRYRELMVQELNYELNVKGNSGQR